VPSWGIKKYKNARDILLEQGVIKLVHKGGHYEGDASLYELAG
jgi:hypothetical protein